MDITAVVKVLRSMRISVKLMITIRVDNVGDISMAGHVAVTSHTKHVDRRFKYVNECEEDFIVNCVCKII